jgi:hypothetical protein
MREILTILSFLALCQSSATAQPKVIHNLSTADLNESYVIPPEIKNFKFWYMSSSPEQLIYLGSKRIAGFETELHLHLYDKKIISYLLILGPQGINSVNCIRRYKEVIKILNKKYGSFVFQEITKDPIIDDLVSLNICDPVRIRALSMKTYWKTKKFKIKSELLGDNEGFYIEIEFISSSGNHPTKAENLFKLL